MQKSLWLSLGLSSTIILGGCNHLITEVNLVNPTISSSPNNTTSQTEFTGEQPSQEDLSALKERRLANLQVLMKDTLEGNLSTYESPNGDYLCGLDYESNHLVILDAKNEIVIDEIVNSPVNTGLWLSFYKWGTTHNWLWLTHQQTWLTKDFCKINLETGDIEYFEQNYGFATDFDLNPDTGYLCYSPFPVILDVTEREEFLAEEHEIPLYLVNLLDEGNMPHQVIATTNNREFQPEWIAPYTISYNNPYLGYDEIEKVTYTFNQPFELVDRLTDTLVKETNEELKEKYEHIIEIQRTSSNDTTETICLYGYNIPINDISTYNATYDDKTIPFNKNAYINWTLDMRHLTLYIDDRNLEDINKLTEFLRLKYAEDTVTLLMNKFKEDDSYIVFTDDSYISFNLTTAGFKAVHIGYTQDE